VILWLKKFKSSICERDEFFFIRTGHIGYEKTENFMLISKILMCLLMK